ncbi:MAG: LysR family transcriptional regulator, partial [Rhodospirillales bacterium]
MNLKGLRVFVYVIEEGTLAKAAERLNLSQPAASRLLGLLESEIGTPLFIRLKKRLVPTAEGDSFYSEAIRILSSVDGIPSFIRRIQQNKPHPLRIVCLPRLSGGLVVPAIARLLQKRPDVRTNLEVCARRNLEHRFTRDSYDVGVGSLPLPMQNVKADYLCSAKFFVMLPKNHKYAHKTALTAKDLAQMHYIALNRHTLLRQILDESLERAGIGLDPHHEVSTT